MESASELSLSHGFEEMDYSSSLGLVQTLSIAHNMSSLLGHLKTLWQSLSQAHHGLVTATFVRVLVVPVITSACIKHNHL